MFILWGNTTFIAPYWTLSNNLRSPYVGFLPQEEEKKSGAERTRYTDFMDRLIEARDENGKGLTLQEIRNEMDTFMFAGGMIFSINYRPRT